MVCPFAVPVRCVHSTESLPTSTVHTHNVQKTRFGKFIGRKRTVIRVVAVRGDQNFSIILRLPRSDHHWRMLPANTVERKLHDIAGLYPLHRDLDRRRANRRLFSHKKIVEIFNARPRGRFSVRVDIIPSKGRRVVHHARPSIDTLRRKIRAVPTDVLIVVVAWIPSIRPNMCVPYCCSAVISRQDQHTPLSPFLPAYAELRQNVPSDIAGMN